jgi:calnexin
MYYSSKALLVSVLAGHAAASSSGFLETFTSESWSERWSYSSAEKYTGKFAIESTLEGFDNTGLKVTEKAQYYGAATLIPTIDPSKGKTVIQYELKAPEPIECGGAYMKFLTADDAFKPAGLAEDTPYTVMFGPDVCGLTNKVHLIIRHENPKTKKIEEKHLAAPPMVKQEPNVTHVYTAVLDADENTYSVLIDGKEAKSGSLFEDFFPAFIAPKEIDDPEDTKPEDWVDEETIPDPTATKPEDWDEDAPAMIPDDEATMPEGWLEDEPKQVEDPEAVKPDDWDDEEDGDWEPPMVPNPKCEAAPGCGTWVRPNKANPDFKGKWTAPKVPNPAYKGVWSPRKIDNPEYFDDKEPLSHIGKLGAVAIEIWTMDKDYFFDNLLVSNSVEEAEKLRNELWKPKFEIEQAAFEAKQKAEDEKRTKEEKEASNEGLVSKIEASFVDMVDAIFFSSLVAPYAENPAFTAVYDLLTEKPMIAIASLCGIVALILTSIIMPKASAKVEKEVAKAKVGQAKKMDITEKDDDATEEEEEDESVSPTRRSRRNTRRD